LFDSKRSGEDRRTVIQHIEKELEEAKDIVSFDYCYCCYIFFHYYHLQLEQMGLEVRELPSATRSKYQTRTQSYTAELTRLENDFKKAKNSYHKAREELLGEGSNSNEDYYDQTQRLIDNTEKLERGAKRLEVGYRVAIETEQIGSQILTDLNHQKETIQRTRSRVCSSLLFFQITFTIDFICNYSCVKQMKTLEEVDEYLIGWSCV
jgi:vesicle transport through interaction with t-SNAREs 1